jgi:hypothetical protein
MEIDLEFWKEVYEVAVEEELSFDVRIRNTSITDWKYFFSLLKGLDNYELFIGDEKQEYIYNVDASLFGKNEYASLEISVNDLRMHCLLLDINLIELEIPLTDDFIEHDLDALLSFLKKLSIQLDKDVPIFLEGSETPIMTVRPNE